jgi:Ni/Fe-hydrogenase 1 B-type cytochrome subunit
MHPALRRRFYVWEWPVRITHWVNVLCGVVFIITGLYIGSPAILLRAGGPVSEDLMNTARWIHFLTATVFIVSILLRIYWAFFGNVWASWRVFFPFLSKEGRDNIRDSFRYYSFLSPWPAETTGHNALAGMAYFVVSILYLVQILTGFALYAEVSPSSPWAAIFGWVPALVGDQLLRLIHHLVMYFLIAFFIHHMYSAWLIGIEEGNGTVGSIFSGFKFLPVHRHRDWLEDSITRERVERKERRHQAKQPPAAEKSG